MIEEANSISEYLAKGPKSLLELYVVGKNMGDKTVSKIVTAASEAKSLNSLGIWCKEVNQRSVLAFKKLINKESKLQSIYLCKPIL